MIEVSSSGSIVDRAEHLLKVFGAAGEDSVLRHSTLQDLGGGAGQRTLEEKRRWAEAWQLLERGGLICREQDESRMGSSWFLTRVGRQVLKSGDLKGTLMIRGVHP